ncbi:hypothetical protein [Streptomyces albiflavescens]|uniref:hypothetical protein n=1 Tax=Streptomyces albiflavescens TaxID=1623582 RepID=UPI00166E6DD8|nr:hypothetical protein [Streptomyces albiflavescens]
MPLDGLAAGRRVGAGVPLTSVYRDRYRKTDGRRYFAERVLSADPQSEHRGTASKAPLVGRFDDFLKE